MGATASDASLWAPRPPFRLRLPSGAELGAERRPLVMGVLNVTPDSFSDGGRFLKPVDALRQAERLCAEGADVLDIGGESTRPGSDPISAQEEMDRVLPVIEKLAGQAQTPISIDTQKSDVARAALEAGAQIVNDVSALRGDPQMVALVAETRVPVVLMHMQGLPRTMQRSPVYREVVSDIMNWLKRRLEFAVANGVKREQIVLDPGFGFGKTLQHNLELLRRLREFHALGRPILVGTSRKSMIGMILNRPETERLHGTLATVACAVLSGCHIVRVHDVGPCLDVVKVCEAIREGGRREDA